MKRAIVNASVVLPDHVIEEGTILIEGDTIAAVGKNVPTEGAEIIDAAGAYAGPGLIDIHTHAAHGDVTFTDDPVLAAREVLKHGTTSVFPALYFSAPKDLLIEQIRTVRAAADSGKAPNIAGLYMEAPYLNPKFGADKTNIPWAGDIRREDYLPVLKAAGDFARVWCVAPERKGIENFVRDAHEMFPKAVFTVAHSEATPDEIAALMPYGLKIATHHTNATGTLNKYPECRGVCVDEAVWYYDDIYAELICDRMGIHVDPFMQRLVRKIKGDDRIILISDSFVDDGPVPPGYDGAWDINFDRTGEIAGTRLMLADACRNIMKHTGCSIVHAFRYAAANPARALGLTDRGVLEAGKRADIILTDCRFHVSRVILGGADI